MTNRAILKLNPNGLHFVRHNISLKESSSEDSQISSNDETSLNNNIPSVRLRSPNFKFHSTSEVHALDAKEVNQE